MGDPRLYLMSATEIVAGYVFGQSNDAMDGPETGPIDQRLDPRGALEMVIHESLERQPLGVAFSGGRDSSLVLAVATHIARREGLTDPVPITRRFPEYPQSDETDWQEIVVRHLGLKDWQRVEIHDELDIVGPIAADHLRTHGVVWPPAIAADRPLVDALRKGTLLDGEGGDQVLGVDAHRAAPLVDLIRRPRPLQRRRAVAALSSLGPPSRRVRTRMAAFPRSWLRPAGQELLANALTHVERDRPIRISASVRRIARRRGEVLAATNRRILADARGVRLISPLLDPRFVDALARDGGWVGKGTRTDVLRRLAADLLPDTVLSRTGKAYFTDAYLGRRTRQFAERWDGAGVDPEFIDAEALRRVWLSDQPMPPTSALLQSAWLANQHQLQR